MEKGVAHIKYKTKPCRYFRQGNCNHGAACSYIHGDAEDAAVVPVKVARPQEPDHRLPYRVVTCRYWANGGCDRGDSCTFLHAHTKKKKKDENEHLPHTEKSAQKKEHKNPLGKNLAPLSPPWCAGCRKRGHMKQECPTSCHRCDTEAHGAIACPYV